MSNTELSIHRGPKDSSILSAALFGPKGQNSEYSPQSHNPKATFYIGENPERLSPLEVTVRSIKALDEWGVDYELTGEAIVWSVMPMGHGTTSAEGKPFQVSITYNLQKETGVVRFERK